MIKRILAGAAAILLSACASTAEDDWADLVTGPKTPLCDAAMYPIYPSGHPGMTPMLCDSSMANVLVAGPGERAYRALWMGGDVMAAFGSLEVLVRADGTGTAGPARSGRRPAPEGAFLVGSRGATTTVELTAVQVAAFETAFAATGFATAPLTSEQGLYACLHADQMIAETLVDGTWRGIARDNCGEDGVIARAIWNLMIDTADRR